jgi:hypothetical protein
MPRALAPWRRELHPPQEHKPRVLGFYESIAILLFIIDFTCTEKVQKDK